MPGQSIPAGLDATAPLPVPAVLTERTNVGGGAAVKVAVTLRAAVMATTQLPVPAGPVTVTVSRDVGSAVKIAVTLFAAFIVTTQLPVALVHAPVQPENVLPVLVVGVSVTTVPDT